MAMAVALAKVGLPHTCTDVAVADSGGRTPHPPETIQKVSEKVVIDLERGFA